MYAKKPIRKTTVSVFYQCLDCEEDFTADDVGQSCPRCLSTSRSNLIILHLEETKDRAEWLSLIDFSAGD